MLISRVLINNYRNLKCVDVGLSSITALIGENNSGKSNFLRALTLPLSAEENGFSKQLSWYDLNKEAKLKYYDFLKENHKRIIDGKLDIEEFKKILPSVSIQLQFTPATGEHYCVKDILIDTENWIGGILYSYKIKKTEDLLKRVQSILKANAASFQDSSDIQMSLLPMELYDYSLTVPGRNSKVPYETLSKLKAVILPAERDNFASSADKLGSRALSDLLQKSMTPEAQANIEKKYYEFFKTVSEEGKLESVLNWQNYSDLENATDFFKQISVRPNMPPMSSILGSVRLGYDEDSMFMQGLGYRNLILMTVLLNSYISESRDISFRLLTVEEPEAHLCISNVRLMASLFNAFKEKKRHTQIVYSTHNVEFVNKIGIENVIVIHNGEAINLSTAISEKERDYLVNHPGTDILKLLYSRKTILVEGITEELLINTYLQTRKDLNDIKVVSFHKGYQDIIKIWKKINAGSNNRLGIVRDFDNQPNAQKEHEKLQDDNVIVRTTSLYTLETDITADNYDLLKSRYGDKYGWSNMTEDQLQKDWRDKRKTEVILQICHDLLDGDLNDFKMPKHIQDIIDFMQDQ